MRFLDVRTDFAFKKVFGSQRSKPVLINFLNAMLDYTGEFSITDLDIVDPYQIPMIQGMKDTYVDVKAVLANGSQIIIEMQVLNVEGFEQRVLYNAAKQYSSQLHVGEHYRLLNPIIALTFTDFVLFKDNADQVMSRFRLIEKQRLIEYGDEIELIFVELPKFKRTQDALENIQQQWIYFIKNAGKLDVIPQSLDTPCIHQAFEMINKAGLSEAELEMQHKRHDFIFLQRDSLIKARKDGWAEGVEQGIERGIEQGIERGVEQGRQAERLAIIRNAHQNGLSPQMIASLVGLSQAEVTQLIHGVECIPSQSGTKPPFS